MKIIFFGTPQIGADILKYLIESEHEMTAVVTQPDREKGRGKKLIFSPVKELALETGIPVLQPARVADDSFLDELEALGADLFVVAAYAQKLPKRILEMPPAGCINVHPSLLPSYRGAAPVVAAILNGDEKTGVTIMEMAEKMDAGDILLQEEIELKGDETTASLEKTAAEVGGPLLLKAIEGLAEGSIVPVKQDESKVSIIRQMDKSAGLIDFNESAAQIERKVRAFDPWPGTYTYLDGKTFKICRAEAVSEADAAPEEAEAEPGCVVYADKKNIFIKTGCGLLKPVDVQIEGKKRMGMEEFLRGKKIERGQRFGS